jgi:hypothetical protein
MKNVVTSALALVACVALPAMAAAQGNRAPKQPICHRADDGAFHVINVDANALPAHLAHGDQTPYLQAMPLPPGTTFSASSVWETAGDYVRLPQYAFDGNNTTEWNAGAGPEQWIEIDFGRPVKFNLMTALVDQVPAGAANHDITFDGKPAFSWTGSFFQGQLLDESFAATQNVKTVRITTTSSPSWVAWVDILFYDGSVGCPAQ